MLRSETLRSTAFRLALIFSGLFFATFLIAGFLAYQIISTDLHDRLDLTLSESFDMIASSYGEGDLEDLVGTLRTYSASTNDHERIFYLADATGQVLAGNVPVARTEPGLSTLTGAAFGLEGDVRYRALKGEIAGNTMVVAWSYEETDELGGLALSSFAWAGVIATAIAVAAGLLLAGAVKKRMDAIGGTMDRVGQGELTARIPLRGSGDDIDVLSGQVNSALERLSALVEGMRQVSVDIAHDLKTPLNRLSIIIESALDMAESGEGNSAELVQAQNEAGRINATFEALLRIAQLESGARRERFTEVSLTSVLSTLAEAYEDVAVENGQSLSLSAEGQDVAFVRGDKDLLTQLFANLIENAIRHAKGGTAIEMYVHRRNGTVSARIVDDGPGIPKDESEKVFRRLYRLEKSRSTEGTGLGLSMVKAIADLHGASVTLSSANPGLAVTINFPATHGSKA
ncbi:HAMP domain-containing sensor histidine kinase [Devosia salina]|uniref:histidine kinase n=1 Tax=Devosia salina TaxID=2860336 RepID=A0ABX8WBR2_9HYPH|nr:HAMP domain-containing sensor histidine kinase [Devosia salina]QYO75570.1 HAMP domain-containing histidine kinase [Devosia salina]